MQRCDLGIGNDVQDLIPQKLINFLEIGPTFLEKSGHLAATLQHYNRVLFVQILDFWKFVMAPLYNLIIPIQPSKA